MLPGSIRANLGSARASRAGIGALADTNFASGLVVADLL
jgi:hypothetical protein